MLDNDVGIELERRRNAVGLVSDDAALPKGNPKSNGAWPQSDFGGAYVATKYADSLGVTVYYCE